MRIQPSLHKANQCKLKADMRKVVILNMDFKELPQYFLAKHDIIPIGDTSIQIVNSLHLLYFH